ncbi:MAG: hypothetical protein ACLUFN_08740 [Eubacterium sp.]
MLYTIADLNDVFHTDTKVVQCRRSSNPYDYIRTGYYIDNAALYGGSNNVNLNCNHPGSASGTVMDITDK